MRRFLSILPAVVFCAALASGQTAEELVARNLAAKGGIEKIKAIKSLRITGNYRQGPFVASLGQTQKAPNLLRTAITIQGMALVQAYDGASGWQINPFEGRRDPELMGEDDLRDLVFQADFYGPLVDYKEKGNTIEYIGKDTVDGDDAYRLKVTLKNGDIVYYLLDPDTYLEIRTEVQHFVRGSVRESMSNLGSYKQVNGVYFPFTVEQGSKRNPGSFSTLTFDKIEANVAIEDQEFKMPAAPAAKAKEGSAK